MDKVRYTIDKLTAERGKKSGGLWRASFSVKDVLIGADLKNTPDNQRYVLYVVGRWYAGSKISPGDGDSGGALDIIIRGI